MKMYKKAFPILSILMLISMVLAACATPATQVAPVVKEVVKTVVVTQVVEVAGTPEVKEVVKTVVVQATQPPKAKELVIFNWWTGPGEREAADAMYKAFNDKYPDIKIVE